LHDRISESVNTKPSSPLATTRLFTDQTKVLKFKKMGIHSKKSTLRLNPNRMRSNQTQFKRASSGVMNFKIPVKNRRFPQIALAKLMTDRIENL
jgi:hypothetical protein